VPLRVFHDQQGPIVFVEGVQHLGQVERFATAANLRTLLSALSGPSTGAVFHAAAVSDFGFGRILRRGPEGLLVECRERKIPTAPGSLLAELVPTPKLLDELRDWFPRARLAGWKFELQGDPVSVITEPDDL